MATSYDLWITFRYTMETDDERIIDRQVDAVEEALRDSCMEPDFGSVTFEVEEADGDV